MNNTYTLILGMFSIVVLFTTTSYSFAESQYTIPLNDEQILEKTVATMSVPNDNVLPWGTVKGTVDNPAYGYPVIIQFFEEGVDEPMHVAQVDVKSNNTYEYKFRVRDINLETGKATNIFEGDYTVKIFKVTDVPQIELDTI